MLTPPRAVLFDLDGTLADSDAALAAGTAGAAKAAHSLIGVSIDAWSALNADVAGDVIAQHLDDWITGAVDAQAISREIYGRMLAQLGANPELVSPLVQAQAEAGFAGQRAFPDVAPLLDALSERGLPSGVVTNGASEVQRASLAAIGLAERFQVLVFSSEHGLAKPDPAIFRLALGELGTAAADTWFIGDNPSTDVAGARAAGLQPVWLNRAGREAAPGDPAPDLEVRSLSGLVALLD